MKKEDLGFLNQLVQSMVEAEVKLERSYIKKDNNNFDGTKKIMIEIQKKISDILR
jgi:hypothetical protein